MKTLETERLIMKNWKEADISDFYEYAKVEGISEMTIRYRESKKQLSCFVDTKCN